LINWNGSIFPPATAIARGGNQWLAWRHSVVGHQLPPLTPPFAIAPQGAHVKCLIQICNEIFRTRPPSC